MASYLFEVYEPRGCLVRLSRLVWEEKILTSSPRGHPEVASYFETVQATIVAPSVVFQSIRRADAEVFYSFNSGRDRYANCHLAVIVKYVVEADEHSYGYILLPDRFLLLEEEELKSDRDILRFVEEEVT